MKLFLNKASFEDIIFASSRLRAQKDKYFNWTPLIFTNNLGFLYTSLFLPNYMSKYPPFFPGPDFYSFLLIFIDVKTYIMIKGRNNKW